MLVFKTNEGMKKKKKRVGEGKSCLCFLDASTISVTNQRFTQGPDLSLSFPSYQKWQECQWPRHSAGRLSPGLVLWSPITRVKAAFENFPLVAKYKVRYKDWFCCCTMPAVQKMPWCAALQWRGKKKERWQKKEQNSNGRRKFTTYILSTLTFPSYVIWSTSLSYLVAKFILTCRKPGLYYSCVLLKGWPNILLSLPRFSELTSTKKETSGVCL